MNVIIDNRTGKIYHDSTISMIRTFEEILEKDMPYEVAKKKYPAIIKV